MAKILGVFHGYPGGSHPLRAGAEMMAHEMLKHLVGRGHEVNVIIDGVAGRVPAKTYTLDGVTVLGGAAKFRTMMVAARNSDVVVTHLNCTQQAVRAAHRVGKPVVVIEHNTHKEHMNLARAMRPDMLVYNSQWMQQEWENVLDVPSVVVHPPVRTLDYATVPGEFVTAVNLYRPKGGELFWKLAMRMPGVQFLAVLGAYGKQVIPVPAPDNVTIIPTTDDMVTDVYSRTRILLLPSRYESWGRVGVEALASGIPVISSDLPGPREALSYAGTYCDREDVDAWVDAIHDLYHGDIYRGLRSLRACSRSIELDKLVEPQLEEWANAISSLPALLRSRQRQ